MDIKNDLCANHPIGSSSDVDFGSNSRLGKTMVLKLTIQIKPWF